MFYSYKNDLPNIKIPFQFICINILNEFKKKPLDGLCINEYNFASQQPWAPTCGASDERTWIRSSRYESILDRSHLFIFSLSQTATVH